MENPLQMLMALLQSQRPGQQTPRPGYGLQGASIQGSDLRDVLRNLPEDQIKYGAMPMSPGGGSVPTGPFNLKYGSRIMKGATAAPTTSSVTGRVAYNLNAPNGGYIETVSEKELLRMIEAAQGK